LTASNIISNTFSGCEIIGIWLDSSSYIWVSILLAIIFSGSGLMVSSFVAIIYQQGFFLHGTGYWAFFKIFASMLCDHSLYLPELGRCIACLLFIRPVEVRYIVESTFKTYFRDGLFSVHKHS